MDTLSPINQEQLPLYIRARNVLKTYINKKGLKPGDKLPSENEIAKALNVSRGTVREALRVLENEGLVICRRGLGTFVMEKQGEIQTGLEKLESTFNIVEQSGLIPRYKGIKVEKILADEPLALKLKMHKGDEIVKIFRLLTANDKPVVFSQDFFPKRIMVEEVKREEYGGSLMELFRTRFNKEISYSKSYLFTVPAEKLVSQELAIMENSQVLYLENNHFTTSNEPVLFSRNYFKESFKFSLLRKR